jgi:hypothetical protein
MPAEAAHRSDQRRLAHAHDAEGRAIVLLTDEWQNGAGEEGDGVFIGQVVERADEEDRLRVADAGGRR